MPMMVDIYKEFQISLKCYSSFSSFLVILNFCIGETRHVFSMSRDVYFVLEVQVGLK